MTVPVHGDPAATMPGAFLSRLTDPHRLAVLRATGLLHGASSPVLDGIARAATLALRVPIAFVALVDDRREHYPGLAGAYGLAGETRGAALSHSGAHLVVQRDVPVVLVDTVGGEDAAELAAFADSGGGAFVGVPLRLRTGETLGALCAIHLAPFAWPADQLATLEDLAAAAVADIERGLLGQALVQTEAKWRDQAERDPQTGLLNRRGFREQSRHHLALAQRTAAPFSIAVIDIDHFRNLNDVFGSEAGDRAIAEMARLLGGVARETDLIARLDGNTFGLLLCNTNAEEASVFRRRFEAALAELNVAPGREYQLRASLGTASWTLETPHTLATLLRVAEESMHIEKGHRAARQQSVADRLSSSGMPD